MRAKRTMPILALTTLSLLLHPRSSGAERVAENVVYGTYSGLALLMDVHYPVDPNGAAVIYIPGSAWHAPLGYSATQLKNLDTGIEFVDRFNRAFCDPLLEAGYTVFVINHRAAPRFRYPAAVDDAQRAVRFIRAHASVYGIEPDRVCAVGYSSGGYLAAMLGLLDGAADERSEDPIEREPAKVRCAVAGGTPSDLTDLSAPLLAPATASFLGVLTMFSPPGSEEQQLAIDASPLHRVSPDDSPLLLIHSENDEVIPFTQAAALSTALENVGVPVRLLRIPGGTHMNLSGASASTDFVSEMLAWLRLHLGR